MRRGRSSAALRWLAAGLSGAVTAQAAAQAASAPDDPFYAHAAACAAALEVDQLAMVARARAGAPALRDAIVETTAFGFTFVGVAYKRGLRNPSADALLHAARAEQQGWPRDRHERVAAACREEARQLFADASGVERWLVRNRAAARVDRYLSSPAPASAPASAVSEGASRARDAP